MDTDSIQSQVLPGSDPGASVFIRGSKLLPFSHHQHVAVGIQKVRREIAPVALGPWAGALRAKFREIGERGFGVAHVQINLAARATIVSSAPVERERASFASGTNLLACCLAQLLAQKVARVALRHKPKPRARVDAVLHVNGNIYGGTKPRGRVVVSAGAGEVSDVEDGQEHRKPPEPIALAMGPRVHQRQSRAKAANCLHIGLATLAMSLTRFVWINPAPSALLIEFRVAHVEHHFNLRNGAQPHERDGTFTLACEVLLSNADAI